MDPTLVPGTWFESQFQICVYEHAILRIYISFFYQRLQGEQECRSISLSIDPAESNL